MAKRGRKPGFKLNPTSTTSDTWYQDFRNLIHYSRYYGNLTEIRSDQLYTEVTREYGWLADKQTRLEHLTRIREILVEKNEPQLIYVVDDTYKKTEQEYKDSWNWYTFLKLCIDEYKKWERVSNGGSIQQQASS